MNSHTSYQDLLPLLAAGRLEALDRESLERHLAECHACRADLELWRAAAAEIEAGSRAVQASTAPLEGALLRVRRAEARPNPLRRAWQLLRAQARLVQPELWPASAAVMALGIAVALLSGRAEAIYFLSPLVAAAGLSMLFNPEYDPAYELTLATPTSPWKVLLARLSIVSAYNLLLALLAACALLLILPPGVLGVLILGWLAPMAFLSALALLLSLHIGTGNAVALTYMLWFAQYVPYQSVGAWMASPAWAAILRTYRQFWHNPLLLFLLALLVLGLALWSAGRPLVRLNQGSL